MNPASIALAVLLALLGGTGGGYLYGHAEGKAAVVAADDHKAVGDLTGIIDSHQALIADANKASADMRQAIGARTAADAKTSKDFRNALNATAAARAGCVFPDDILRDLAAARERASQAASGGVLGNVLGGPAGSGQQQGR